MLEGEFDAEIAALSDTLALLTGETYLAIGLNVDSPVWGFDSTRFRKTYAYVATRLRPGLGTNVKLTLYVNGAATAGDRTSFEAFFPGDDLVDALAFNVTRVRQEDFDAHPGLDSARYDQLLTFARAHELPVLILDSSADAIIAEGGLDGAASVAAFYDPFFDFLAASPEVRYYAHQNRWLSDTTVLARWRRRLDGEASKSPQP